ncbi:hypothetical protein Tco_0201057, partial [Tanacetum coccineum]
RQIPLFKCDWVNHKAGGVKHDLNLGYTLVDLNSLGHKDDSFILASQARQVFYVKDQIDKKLSIVFRTPTKNYKDTYDEVDEEFSTVIHEHNDNILPRLNRRDLGNESQNDYYRIDCEGRHQSNTPWRQFWVAFWWRQIKKGHRSHLLLDDPYASWPMDVDTGESAISIALGASATGTIETIIVGGLKYSSSKDWNKVS